MRRKRLAGIHLESASYDWFRPPRVGRNGFDFRWRYLGTDQSSRPSPERLCVDQEIHWRLPHVKIGLECAQAVESFGRGTRYLPLVQIGRAA
jgi:hypothetical protein